MEGNPSYNTQHRDLRILNDTVVRVKDIFGYYEGKIVLQLTENKRLKDEFLLTLKGGKPWLITSIQKTGKASSTPSDMVLIPGTDFSFNVTTGEEFMPYPDVSAILLDT
jgi:hypothetical protein